jgi:AmmeMemoRadiSam system protein A
LFLDLPIPRKSQKKSQITKHKYQAMTKIQNSNSTSKQPLSPKQGQILLTLARHTIMQELGQSASPEESGMLRAGLNDEGLQSHCGTFVTLKRHGRLRGCIGTLTATESIVAGIRRNAVNAAFHDPRFSPLDTKEMADTEIEVSVLTEPRPLEYSDDSDLIKKLRVNVDGVILRKDYAGATFLPQVWEQLPRAEDFLGHLCMKAGLPNDAWRTSKLEIMTYQVQYFEEEK